jgi:transmembrane sensor
MTIADGQAGDHGEVLAREAAHWFAGMRSPDAEHDRAAFEAWLGQAPEHRVAYNRAAEIFAMGKLLAEPDQPAPVIAAPRRRRVPAMALASIAACAIAIGGWVASHPSGPPPDRREAVAGTTDHRTISAITGKAEVVRLADGSTVRLGDGAVLNIDIGDRQRSFRLLQGQARFEVAHEQRPFIVLAGGGSVTARGTIFEVALAKSGKVEVRLLRGAVDVALPPPSANAWPAIRKLAAGQRINFMAQPDVPATPVPPAAATGTPSATARDFGAIPVFELVAIANQGAARPIRLADASLADRRVSGRFRVDDTELLARRLGALFGRGVDASNAHEIVLAPAGDSSGANKAGK